MIGCANWAGASGTCACRARAAAADRAVDDAQSVLLMDCWVERSCADVTRAVAARAIVRSTGISQQLLKHARSLNRYKQGPSHRSRHRLRAQRVVLGLVLVARAVGQCGPARARLHGARDQRGGAAAAAAAGVAGGGPRAAARGAALALPADRPAAASAHDGQLQMASPMQMMRGGSFGSNKAEPNGRAGHLFNASLVDVVRWLHAFALDDFVVLKMDIEGAENEIVPALLATNTSRLVDVLLWECHLKLRGLPGKCQCAAWDRALKAAGVKAIYHDPYPFAKASDSPEFVPG